MVPKKKSIPQSSDTQSTLHLMLQVSSARSRKFVPVEFLFKALIVSLRTSSVHFKLVNVQYRYIVAIKWHKSFKKVKIFKLWSEMTLNYSHEGLVVPKANAVVGGLKPVCEISTWPDGKLQCGGKIPYVCQKKYKKLKTKVKVK